MFWKGSTAIDGLSGRASGGAWLTTEAGCAVETPWPASPTCQTRIGSAMFFRF
jgi:hypothetical protein